MQRSPAFEDIYCCFRLPVTAGHRQNGALAKEAYSPLGRISSLAAWQAKDWSGRQCWFSELSAYPRRPGPQPLPAYESAAVLGGGIRNCWPW